MVDDRELAGAGRIRDWVNELVADGILLKAPKFSSDGTTVSWVARQSRRDWRQIGMGDVATRYEAQVRDGKIVRWTSTYVATDAPSAPSTSGAKGTWLLTLLAVCLALGLAIVATRARAPRTTDAARATEGTLLSRLRVRAVAHRLDRGP